MLIPSTIFTVSDESRALCADVKSALKRADRDLTAVAIDIGGHSLLPKLSNQLNGHEPPTLLWRVLAHMGPSAWVAFLELRAVRIGREVVPADLGALVAAVRALTTSRRVMARADLPEPQQKASSR